MNNINGAVWVEFLKARRSKMSWATVLGFMFLPLAMGFFMIVIKDPELARRVGLISAKAHILAGAPDWPTYMGLLAQGLAGGGMVLFGLIGIWVFGREYSDHTIKDLLALPTARSTIVAGKFIVVALWSVVLTVLIGLVALVVGGAIGLDQATPQVIGQYATILAIAAFMALVLVTPTIYVANAGRGYLPPFGFMLLTLLFTQLIAAAGWGEYFPWSIPLVYSQGTSIGPISYVIVILTGIAGIAGTFAWWKWADQAR